MRQLLFLLFIITCLFSSCQMNPDAIEYFKWQTVSIDFEGPMTSETAQENPFSDYRLDVKFIHKDKTMTIPGYYAADGNGKTDSGNIWRVKFTPDLEGKWDYEATLRKGKNIAIELDVKSGSPVDLKNAKGTFDVGPVDKNDPATRGGRLSYVGERYLKFQETGEYFLKGGPNSPENFLAYQGFDGTFPSDTTKNFIKSYEAHIKDYEPGVGWGKGKSEGIIGALNYIASKGMNTVYFLTMNIEGDGRDVWPYIAPDQMDRFDCSKLDQWDLVFDHAQRKGIMLHFVTQETENEMLLDNGDTGYFRKLYYRELVARFGHHLMITWNLGEENGPASFTPIAQNDRQRKDMAAYLKAVDPYDNYLVVHTHSWVSARDSIVDSLYNFQYLDGLSLQIDKRKVVHRETKKYIQKSKEAGRIWVSPMDEIGLYWMGAMPDSDDPNHDTLRQEVLWGHLMAGGPGVEWYFGYKYPPADLDCEDWRSRENLWEQTNVALEFFRTHLPFWEMNSHDELLASTHGWCFAKPGEIYAVYFKQKDNAGLKVEDGSYTIEWFDPKIGGPLFGKTMFEAKSTLTLKWPENYKGLDCVALIKKVN